MMQKKILFLLIITTSLFFVSCEKNNKKALIKEWKLVKIQSPKMEKVVQKLNSEQRNQYKKMMRNLIEKSSFVFKEDDTYEITVHVMGATEKTQGTWEVDEEKSLLILKEDATKEDKNDKQVFKFSYDQEKLILTDDGKKTIIELIPA